MTPRPNARLGHIAASALLWTACAVAPVAAAAQGAPAVQQMPGRQGAAVTRQPPLFGGGIGPTAHSLIVSGDVSGGTDTLVATDAAGLTLIDRRGGSGVGSGSLAYQISRGWIGARLAGASEARYFQSLGRELTYTNYASGGATMDLPLTARTHLGGRLNASYLPISASTLFPDLFRTDGQLPLPTQIDLASPYRAYFNSDAGVSLSHALSRRSSLGLEYVFSYSGPLASDSGPTGRQRIEGLSAAFNRTIGRGLSLRLGYGQTRNRNSGSAVPAGDPVDPTDPADPAGSVDGVDGAVPGRYTHRFLDVGVDYNRALSFSRSTTLSFSTGSVAVTQLGQTRFDITGNVNLSHQLTRSWSTGVSYNRDVGFVQTFARPVFSDSISASIAGQLGRRITVSSGTGASSGRVGLASGTNGFRAYQSTAGMSLALSRYFALNVRYAYYRYGFDQSDLLTTALATRVRRHSFQIGTGIALPLIERSRRSNAAR